MMDANAIQGRIGELCHQFRLPTMGAQSVSRFTAAGHGDALETLLEVLEQEAENLRQRRIVRLRTASRLPAGKTWETFEYHRMPLALRQQLDHLAQGSFVERGVNVLDSACSLTGARYGVITLLDDSGRIEDFVTSGLTAEERQRFVELPEGLKLFEHLSRITEPLRLRDFHSHTRALGLPEFRPPMAVSPVLTFLAAPIRHLGESVGAFYVGEKDVEFTPEDEETLVMFASQAALVIANARRHRDERRAKTGLETLVNTTPVGVLVFDAKTGAPVSLNREARRIVNDLCAPGGSAEQLLEVLTFRRADGREVSLEEFPLA